jgi:hypothetical protein
VPNPIHWAYASYFGTGSYELSNGQSVYILSAEPGWEIRESELSESGRQLGFRLKFPVAIGAYHFDPSNLGETLQIDNVSMLSAVPGLEVDIPLNEKWSLRPLAHVGWGTEIHGDASAWIYRGGLKSEGKFTATRFNWALINGLTLIGYHGDSQDYDSTLSLLNAVEFDHTLMHKRLAGRPVQLHWHVGYTAYFDDAKFTARTADLAPVQISNEWEIGGAFSTGEHRLGIRRLRWDRVGIAYRFSTDGSFKGIRLTFKSLYDR